MRRLIRYLGCIVLAAGVTVAAFYLMHWLITASDRERAKIEPPPGIRFGPVEIDERVETRDRRRPPPPPPPTTPPPPPQMEITQVDPVQQNLPRLDLPKLDLSRRGTGPMLAGLGSIDRTAEGGVVPLVRIQPQYPRSAAMNLIEGWVEIEFTIDESGSVQAPRVIASNPPRIFDREALRAIARWKFKPKIVDGKPVPQQATQIIDFNMGDL